MLTPGIPRWSPTRVLVWRSSAYLWESGRDPEFSDVYGRTWKTVPEKRLMYRTGRSRYAPAA
ncbi:hypothetical protein CONLIGDRAFT_628188 [Coniochaeta ligniaria NRRL 30616]|uniref:Uncharacterized protein n=1 Tax=Coniochaeta ligniaria NRRL 30616 TaxID=1408157 RepID=A0A1J7JTG8_9PEZI|nr:hypothetical protein CONLIGDRAFT_628188 [Coniochaeta ligniaria NRRL 30616]